MKGGLLKKVLAYCEPMTLVHISLVVLTRFIYAIVGPLHQTLVADIVNQASGESWAQNAFNGCLAWMVIFCMDWWVCDFINIVCEAKATESITIKLRNELFQAIMRQDTVFFETHDAGWVQDRLKHDCRELSHKILMFPVHMFSDVLQIVAKSIFLYYLPAHDIQCSRHGLHRRRAHDSHAELRPAACEAQRPICVQDERQDRRVAE